MINYLLALIIIVIYATNVFLLVSLLRHELNYNSPFIALWFTLLILVLPSIGDIFIHQVEPHYYANMLKIDDYLLLKAQLYICYILLLFRIGIYFCSREHTIRYIDLHSVEGNTKNVDLLFFVFSLFFIVPVYEIYSKYGLSFLSSFTFTDRRENISFLSNFILSYNLMFFAGYAASLAFYKRYKLFAVIFIAYSFVFIFLGGSRQPIIAIIIAVFFLYSMRGSKGLKFYVVASVVFAYSLGLLKILLYLRNLNGFTERIDALVNLGDTFQQASLNSSGEGNLRFIYYYFLSDVAIKNDFFKFQYFFRTLMFWMPSFADIFHMKPADFEYTMFRNVMNGEVGTMHPTLFGAIFADSGYFIFPWVFLMLSIRQLMLWVLQKFDGRLNIILWSIIAFSCLMIARGAMYGPIVICLFSTLMSIFMSKIIRILNVKSNIHKLIV